MNNEKLNRPVDFRDWAYALHSSPDLPEAVKGQFGITIRWYLTSCRHEGLPVTMATAKRFLEIQIRAKDAKDWQETQWRNALRWFFRTARPRTKDPQPVREAPQRPQTADENGGRSTTEALPAKMDWREVLVKELRRRHYALATEKGEIRRHALTLDRKLPVGSRVVEETGIGKRHEGAVGFWDGSGRV